MINTTVVLALTASLLLSKARHQRPRSRSRSRIRRTLRDAVRDLSENEFQ